MPSKLSYLKKYISTLTIFLFLALSGCGGENEVKAINGNLDGEKPGSSSSSKYAFFEDSAKTVAVQVLTDATDSKKWVYYDLDNFSIVNPIDPENDDAWDIAFKRFVIKVNGGVSGAGGVEVATFKDTSFNTASSWNGVIPDNAEFATDRSFLEIGDEELLILANNPFFFVCAHPYDDITNSDTFCVDFDNKTIERDKLNSDEAAYAFLTQGSGQFMDKDGKDGGDLLGWYDYYFHEFHLLRPAEDVHLIRTSDGEIITFEMVGYYGYEEGDAPSGTVSFRFASFDGGVQIPPPGTQPLIVTINSVTSGTAPLPVLFVSNVENIEGTARYAWDFNDDGETDSNLKNPQHTFEAGKHTVSLKVTDDRGTDFEVHILKTIIVEEAVPKTQLEADAGNNLTLDIETEIDITLDGSNTKFKDNTTAVSYIWSSSNANYNPDDVISPTVTFSEAGTFTFTLTVTDSEGSVSSDDVTYTIIVPGSPQASVSVTNENNLFIESSIEFSGTNHASDALPTDTYAWDFGDGTTSTLQNPNHTYTNAGKYTTTLVVTNLAGSSSDTITISVKQKVEATKDLGFYEFIDLDLGLHEDPPVANGDTNGLGVFNNQTNHGLMSLIGFNIDAYSTAETLGSGNFKISMMLYATCSPSEHVRGCVGQAGVPEEFSQPTYIDVQLYKTTWEETSSETRDGLLTYQLDNPTSSQYPYLDGITEGLWLSSPYGVDNPADVFVTFTQDGSEYTDDHGRNSYTGIDPLGSPRQGGWIEVNITPLYEAMLADGNSNYSILLTQEYYDVTRYPFGLMPPELSELEGAGLVSSFCDKESSLDSICSTGDYKPYLIIEED